MGTYARDVFGFVAVLVFVVGVGTGAAAPVDPDEAPGNDREFVFGSVTLGVVTVPAPVPATEGVFRDSVLRPAWNLRSAANAAASLALGPGVPLPLGDALGSEDITPSLASGGVLFGTVMTCLTGVGAGGAGPDGGFACIDVVSRSRGAGDATSPGAEGAFLALVVGVASS